MREYPGGDGGRKTVHCFFGLLCARREILAASFLTQTSPGPYSLLPVLGGHKSRICVVGLFLSCIAGHSPAVIQNE